MANLNDIVSVDMTASATSVQQEGFGKPLVCGYHTRFAERAREYASIAEMEADGFVAADAEHKHASAIFAQSPAPDTIIVGRRALAPDLEIRIYPTAANSTQYAVEVDGVEATYTSDASATVAEITAGLTTAIDAITTLTVSDQTTYVRIKASSAGTWFSVKPVNLALLKCSQHQADPGIATDLAAINLVDDSWYTLLLTTQGPAEIEAAADWCLANSKTFAAQTQDGDVIVSGSGDICSTILGDANSRVAMFFHPDNSELLAAAAMGAYLSADPGSKNLKFVQPEGTAAIAYTAAQIAQLKAKRCNFLTTYGGVNIVSDGVVSKASTYFDQTHGRDWIKSRVQANVANALINAGKTPYTDEGIAAVKAAILRALQEGVDTGYIAASPAPAVTAPKLSAVSNGDKASRTLNNVTFSYTEAGAINSVAVDGVVSI